MKSGVGQSARVGSLLAHPVMVVCLGLLVVNDHVLKARFHNAFTGKLSDFAGLALFPVLLATMIEVGSWVIGRPGPARSTVLLCAGIGTAVSFAAIQASPWATDLYRVIAGLPWSGQSSVTADLTDLIAVPAVAAGWFIVARQEAGCDV